MFKKGKSGLTKIDLGSINHMAPTIYEALRIEKRIFDECMAVALAKSERELVDKHKITWEDLMPFQSKILTERISKLWGIRKRTYEITLETFVETIIVFRSLVTDCVPCGEGEQFREGMRSAKNEIGACITPGCPAHS